LYHSSGLGEYFLGSDSITNSYKNHKRKTWLTQQIHEEVQELFDTGSTIGAYTLFPNNRVDKQYTINQACGVNSLVDDRFDLTLECIRLFYEGQQTLLYDAFRSYKNFFDLFYNFKGYIDFFLLNDLVDENENIKFYLPFDNCKTRPTFKDVEEYLIYKEGVMNFIKARNKRIENYAKQQTTE